MNYYDAVIVLGSKPNTTTWEFPSHVPLSLDEAGEIWQKHEAKWIIVSGKWALSFDKKGIAQPYKECDHMAEYLSAHGIPTDAILKEGESKDTISNLFYIKRTILQPRQLHTLLFITAEFRLERLQFLAGKILGQDYSVAYKTVPAAEDEIYPHEQVTFARTKEFLHDMPNGDDSFLEGKFYEAPYYTY